MLKNYPYRDQDAGGTGGPVDREALRILRDQNEVLFQILGNTRQRTEAQKEFASLNNDITKQIKDQLLLKETDVALDQTTVRSKEKANQLNLDLTQYLKRDTKIDYVVADLLGDDGWDEAMDGVDAVFHVAGPYDLSPQGPAEDHIRPHEEGTIRVLNAAKNKNVKRVILTSTAGTVWMGTPLVESLGESNWNDVSRKNLSPYMKGKTLGERAAWDFVEKNKDIRLHLKMEFN